MDTPIPFYEAVLKRKIHQICESVGYNAISQDSFNVLTDLYARFILQLGIKCKDAANRNRRSEVALVDLVQAYDLLNISIPELRAHIEEVKLPFPVEIDKDEPEPVNRVQRNLIEEEKESLPNNEITNDTETPDENGPQLLRDRFLDLVNEYPDREPVSAVKFEIPKQVTPKPKIKVKVKPLINRKITKEIPVKIPTPPLPTPTPPPIHIPTPPPIRIPTPPPATSSSTPPQLIPSQDAELCPTCNLPDDGSMMIQCDNVSCARWFHGNCVGVTSELEENVTWFCNSCSKPKEVTHRRSTKKKPEVKSKPGRKKSKQSKKVPTPSVSTTPPPPASAPVSTPPPPLTPGAADIDLCPTCNLPDDGSMMIQCDDPTCARWFHSVCVGLKQMPPENECWFCKGCIDKQQSAFGRRRAK